MGALQAEGIEQADGVLGQVAQGIGRSTRLVADRSAGVAVVVADDEAGAGHQSLAEPVLPPVHRGCPSHDEEDRGIGGISEGFDAYVHPVRPDDPLTGPREPNLGVRRGRTLFVALSGHDEQACPPRSGFHRASMSRATSERSSPNWCPRPSNSRTVALGSFSLYSATCPNGTTSSSRPW